jgi:hypothetical protein
MRLRCKPCSVLIRFGRRQSFSSRAKGRPWRIADPQGTVDQLNETLNVALELLFNFHEDKLVDGISRLVLPGANKPRTEGNEGNEV